MKQNLAFLSVLALLAAWVGPALAGQAILLPGSRLMLEGNSTLHPFECRATSINTQFSFPGESLQAAVDRGLPVILTVTIPVAGLVSKHAGLDQNLRKALKAVNNPDIVFSLASYRAEKGAGGEVQAQGSLTVAEVTRPETISGRLSANGASFVIDGERPLLMTDFAIKPPTMMLGAIKTDNRVVVKFHLELKEKTP